MVEQMCKGKDFEGCRTNCTIWQIWVEIMQWHQVEMDEIRV